jgi:ATP-dependent RNA helicase DDX21
MLRKRERKSSTVSANGSVKSEKFEKINSKKQKIADAAVEEDDFVTLGISEHIAQKLKEKSILTLFEVQKKVYQPVYDGKHVICASLTGSGKTLAFVLPIVQKNNDKNRLTHQVPVCLVMTPTRELSIQVGREFTDLSSEALKFKVALIYGGVSIDDQIYKLRGGIDIVVGTPGRIMDMIERGELLLQNIRTVVLDEADKMLSMGFQEPIEEIFQKIHAQRAKVQVCLISATIERRIKQVASKIMKNEECEFIDLMKDLAGRTPKTVQHLAVNSLKSDKVTTIADLILCYGGKNKATIVFVNTKRECNDLMISDKIKQEVQIVHGDINQKQREATIEGFKKGKFKCLVATDVASRGLDIPMVDLVIQSEPPVEVDTYIHRAGRTARAGRTGTCITLYSRYTEGLITRIEQRAKMKFKKIGAPQKKEIVESSIRDITTSMNKVDDSMVEFFTNSAKKVIDEYGAEVAVARLFAYVSGHTDKIKARSLLCGAEGFITYAVNFTTSFNHAGFVWGFFKRILPENIKDKIRGMRPTKTMDGCIFDYPEESHKEFEEIIYNDKLYGTNYKLTKIDELPEVVEENSNYGGANSFGGFQRNNFGGNSFGGNKFGGNNGGNSYGGSNGGNSYGGSNGGNRFGPKTGGNSFNGTGSSFGNNRAGSDRTTRSHSAKPSHGKVEFFIGNLPYKIDETKMKQFIGAQGIDTTDLAVRFAIDKETNEHRGFGFLCANDRNQVDKILGLNGKSFMNKALKVNEASTNSK